MNSEQVQFTEQRFAKAPKNTDLFIEMRDQGIDPIPLLEIAAHDLLNQYGNDAVRYSIQIEKDFTDEGDIQSAEIWQIISHYLQTLNGPGELIAH